MRKFISALLSIIMCLVLMAGLVVEGLHYGIKNTVRETASKGSCMSELPSVKADPKTTEDSAGYQAMTLLRAEKEDTDIINKVSLVLNDTTFTLIGSAICDALDECGVSYKRSDIMGIMSDVKYSEAVNNILFEVAVRIVNRDEESNNKKYPTGEIIEVIENHKDEVESFFGFEFQKFNIDVTQDLLDQIAKRCSDKVKTKITLSIEDNYVFTHLIEAIIGAFRDVIDTYITNYLNSIQYYLSKFICEMLDQSGLEYSPDTVDKISYDIVNSDEMVDVVYDALARVAELVTSGKTSGYADEICKVIDRHAGTINRFIREELEKFDIRITGDDSEKIAKWYQESTGSTERLDPDSPTFFTDILKGYVIVYADTIDYALSGSQQVFDELEKYVPIELVEVLAYILPEENMTILRIGYISGVAASSLFILAVAVPHFRVLKSLGVSGIVSGLFAASIGGIGYLAGLFLRQVDVDVVKMLVAVIAKQELTLGLIAFGSGLVLMITHAIVASSVAKAASTGAATVAASQATAPSSASEPASEAQSEQPSKRQLLGD
ncbi:MAG: hypothetical protein K6F14_05070 [Clostridiales bacterium]|nr:hypothetical protein [Clostridiales bacterium]